MKYGKAYEFHDFTKEQMDVVHAAKVESMPLQDGKIEDNDKGIKNHLINKKKRNSQIAWVKSPDLRIMLLEIMIKVNYTAAWNLGIAGLEPPQYTKYNKGGFYNWHMDQGPPMLENNWLFVRKVSMTLNLTDPKEYEGGELELEIDSPNEDNWQSDSRSVQLKGPKNSAVFFLSDTYHRILPIQSGTRKSLVAWFIGNPYI